MPYGSAILTSIRGRRLGLQKLTTFDHGGRGAAEMLVGPEEFRRGVTTAETTGNGLKAHGVSHLTSANSSAVYILDPPIPGARKVISIGTTGVSIWVKTKNAETFNTTLGTSFTTIRSSAGGYYELMGITTAVWGVANITSGTSSQASGHVLSTTT